MKKQLLWCMAALSFSAASAQTYETRFDVRYPMC